MTIMQETANDRSALVYRHYEQLYRLALLIAGDVESAARLVEQAYRELPKQPDATEVEPYLIRALLRGRAAPRGRRAARLNRSPAQLDRDRTAALLDILAGLPDAARLMVGLHYLRGLTLDEVGALLGEALGHTTPGEILTHFRLAAARGLGLVPADTDDAALLALDRAMEGMLSDQDAIALRRAVLDQPGLRAARDGLSETRDLLQQAIPALCAAAPPFRLVERLLEIVEKRQRTRRQRGLIWARGGLTLGVLALATAIVLLPSLLARRASPPLVRPPSAAELIDAATHRFDRVSLQTGVLHEQYRIQISGEPAYLIERWYDFAAPHQLAVSVGLEGRNQPPLMRISSDGRSLVQYRYSGHDQSVDARSVDARVSEAEAQAALPLLRTEPTTTYFSRSRNNKIDIAPLYLAQARASRAALLGQTNVFGRPAFLLSYRAAQLPTQSSGDSASADHALQIILTIDSQTYALLDVAVVADGTAESTALHPLRALVFEVAASAPADQFRLPADAGVVERTGLPSARAPEIPSKLFISLDDAMRRAPHAILAPQELPSEAMRGLALPLNDQGNQRVVLLYEGEFQSVLVSSVQRRGNDFGPTGEERSAGDFRYRIIQLNDQPAPQLGAIAYRAAAPDETVFIMLVDENATAAEREARLQQLITSLTPVTEQNLPALQRNFYGPTTAGAQG